MNLKKISGKTLDEARATARETYGDRYVIVETGNSTPTSSAYITIALEPVAANRAETGLPPSEAGNRNESKNRNTDDTSVGRNASRGRMPVARNGEKPAGLVTPLLKQIDRLIESGTETLSTLKKISTPEAVKKAGHLPESKNEAGTFPGVTYIKSATDSSKPDSRNTVQAATDAAFRQHFRKKPSKPDRQETGDRQLDRLKHRLETLEKMVWNFTDNHSPWSGDPLYRFLRDQKFQPEFLTEWMGDFPVEAIRNGKNSEAGGDLLHQQIRARVETYFESADPFSRSNKHLFTSFPGVNVTRLISALANRCRRHEQKFSVGIIFSDSFENDEMSFQLMDAFKSINTECRDIVTHRDWQNLSAETDPDTLVFLVTHPMPYNCREVESAWSHFNRVLGEYHAVKHHFIAHSLHNPSEIIQMLPLSHPFSPDYIDLINLEMSQAGYGRLTEYRETAGFEFGFYHRDGHSRTDPFGMIEENLASLVFRDFKPSGAPEKTGDSLFLHV